MKESLAAFEISRSEPAYRQISEKLRRSILSGNFPPGTKLPSTTELAALWQAQVTTIQAAMAPLVKEGLVVRHARKGTFVREREEKLTCVGVYGGADIKGSPYAHAVRGALNRELHDAGIETILWMDPRPSGQRGEPWKPLFKAIEERRFQALIVTEVDATVMEWQRKLPLPMVFQGAPTSVPNSVDIDLGHFVDIGLKELAKQGCRSVGLISPLLDEADARQNPEGFRIMSFDMLKRFADVAADLGLTIKNEWMKISGGSRSAMGWEEKFGYEEFLKLWSQPEKPEGLLVCTDIAARGVVTAVREKQVRVPGELKLALSKNESIDLFCPMPATFVVSSEREIARALIAQVQKQFRGESCERISLPFKIEAHN